MTNWVKFLKDTIGGFSGDGGAAQDDSIKASLDLAHTDLDAIITDTTAPEIIKNIFDIDMGYWTEVDTPGRVTIDYANERIAIADLDRDEDVYVYKATDASVDDFILDFEFQVLNTSVNGSTFGIGLADGLGTMEDVSNGLYAYIYFGGANSTSVYLAHLTSGTKVMSGSIASLLDDTTYYGRLIRRGSYCWLGIYSDKIRETHVTGSPVEYRDVTPNSFTHLYPMSGEDDGSAAMAMDAYVEAIELISAPDIDKYLRPGEGGTNTTLSGIDTKVDTVDTVVDGITDKIGLGGSGADGAKTVAASENITPDTWYEYTTLTVDSGQTLGLSGAGRMLLRCSGKVTVDGTISVVGKGTAGGAAGAGGAINTVGDAGSAGVAGDTNGGLVSGGGGGGGGGASGTFDGGAGGVGGVSTDTGCGTAGSAGAAGVAATSDGGAGGVGDKFGILTDIDFFLNNVGKLILNTAPGGGGGGGGGGDAGAAGKDGGAGGAGGGCVLIIAPEVDVPSGGIISSSGAGGSAGTGTALTRGAGGGGAGGTGGNIIIITKKYTNAGNVTVAGGAGGAGGVNSGYGNRSGGAGGAGGAGNLKVVLV